jgi:hypothetical protein
MRLRKRLLPMVTKLLFVFTLSFAFLYGTSLYMLRYSSWARLQFSYQYYGAELWNKWTADLGHDIELTRTGLIICTLLYLWALAKCGVLNKWLKLTRHYSGDEYSVSITNEGVTIARYEWPADSVLWKDVRVIMLVNTYEGPWLHDIWLTLISEHSRCMIPHGSKGFDEVYKVVSKYEGFDFDNFYRSLRCPNNAEFLLWTKKWQGGIASMSSKELSR